MLLNYLLWFTHGLSLAQELEMGLRVATPGNGRTFKRLSLAEAGWVIGALAFGNETDLFPQRKLL